MTDFFAFETLTWPEIKSLPRYTPLVIPLGGGYDLSMLENALQNPGQAGLLPPIPYGWRTSSLAVAEDTLETLLLNLLNSLRDDGFSQVFALAPQGVCNALGANCLHLPQPFLEMPDPILPANGDQEKVVLIPVGHTEQHAYHLPLSTDTLIIEAIAQGVAAQAPDRATSLPVMPYGVSSHRASFAATLNTGMRAFEDFYLSAIEHLVGRGFERIYLLSGHGGNCLHMNQVVKMAGERFPQTFIATAWLYLSGPQGIAALDAKRQSAIGGMGHACELETSIILHLHPEWVHMERVVDETDFISTPSYYMDWVEGGALVANPPWEDDTLTGAYGAGSLGTAEKGVFWLQAAIEEKIAHVEEIHEQYLKRKARRLERSGKRL